MPDVNVSIGTENSQISDSDIRVGNINSLEHLYSKVTELSTRVADIEKLLGGNLGIPGLTQQVLTVKKMTTELKQELSEMRIRESSKIPPGSFVVLLLSVGAMCIAVLSTALGLWR